MSKKSFRNRHLFIVGAQRSGTSYLWQILDAHPGIVMAKPLRPEPKYFLNAKNIAQGYVGYKEQLFPGADPSKWLGEKSTSYIEREDVARNISLMIPDAAILVILRDPVERAVSNYYFTRANGMEQYEFRRAIQEEPQRITKWDNNRVSVSPHAYVSRGRYLHYLEYWKQHVGSNRLILCIAEHFHGNEEAVRNLYARLELDATIIPACINERVNADETERKEHEITTDLRDMLAEYYRPWNLALARQFGLDLSCWRGM